MQVFSNQCGPMEYNYGAWQVIPTSKFSNVFSLKCFVVVVDAPWFVPNFLTQLNLLISSVKEEIKKHSVKYSNLFIYSFIYSYKNCVLYQIHNIITLLKLLTTT